jgi:hypothetical protein
VIRIIAAALTGRGALIERLGVRDISAEQSRLVLDRAASLAKMSTPERRCIGGPE